MNILTCWIGNTDLTCAVNDEPDNLGPIGQALCNGDFSQAILLDNYQDDRIDVFSAWLHALTGIKPEIRPVSLTSPTSHKEIYEAARKLIRELQQKFPDANLTFHVSPGTPAMALVWLLLAPSCGAKVIESSRVKGVQPVQFPFEIAAYFLPDKDLARLAEDVPPAHPAFADILGNSRVIREAITQAQHVAPRNVTVLIEGESGTGKELFARAIHGSSLRNKGPFVPVNCGAIPAELVESHLFGHKKGSFSGATADSRGFFQEADQGTLFLDELGELPSAAQVKLLRAIQERAVTPVGGTKAQPVDVRIVAATNCNLMQAVAEGWFRSDLFYRLAVAILRLPPLRSREGDVELLLEAALQRANAELGERGQINHKKFSDSSKKIMLRHSWPGNVRELHNTVMRAVLWSRGNVIDEENARQSLLLSAGAGECSILDRPVGNGFSLQKLVGEVAAHYISRAEKESGSIMKKSSDLLGFDNYQTFANWRKKYVE
jgi:Response regulator containing CheY-like receiver, AAA-type ATPase, and DNA-binding domains